MIQIKHYISGAVLYEGEHETLRDAVKAAVKARANLDGANLDGANLDGANLDGAKDTDTMVLPEGITLAVFKSDVLPTLLLAGGKELASLTRNRGSAIRGITARMHHGFNARNLEDVPAVWRPWAERFVHLYDNGLLPWACVVPEVVP